MSPIFSLLSHPPLHQTPFRRQSYQVIRIRSWLLDGASMGTWLRLVGWMDGCESGDGPGVDGIREKAKGSREM